MKSMSLVAIVGLLAFSVSAHAWDCTIWSQSTYPTGECYKTPESGASTATSGSTSNATAQQNQGQQQVQSQGQHQVANGGNATASNTGDVQATNVNASSYGVRQAPSVGEGTIIISGCAVSGNAGGSNTHGSAFLGIGFTTSECYAFILAQAYQAVGEKQTACQILNTTNAAARAVKRGITLPACFPPPPIVVNQPVPVVPGTYTKEQVDQIVRKIVSK